MEKRWQRYDELIVHLKLSYFKSKKIISNKNQALSLGGCHLPYYEGLSGFKSCERPAGQERFEE